MYGKANVTIGTIFVAVFLAILMLGFPSFIGGNHDTAAVGQASAGEGDRVLRVSVIELTTAINTLNPLTYTMGQEMDVIWPCYSGLLTRDVNGQLIGDLAESWSSSPDGLTWHFDIVHTANFYNRLDTVQPYHPLTWDDVRYTFELCRDSPGNSFLSYFPKDTNGVNVFNSVTRGADDYSFDVHLNWVYSPFLSSMSSIPILPRYIWETQAWNWANYDIRNNIAPIVGSGTFYYTLDGRPTGSVVELAKNDNWFAIEERGWQSHVDRLVWKSEASESSNLNDFQTNNIDVMQYVTGTQYTDVILAGQIPGAVGMQVSGGFIVEFCANQMPDYYRNSLPPSIPMSRGTNSQLLLDETVRLAFMMSIDRQALVDGALDGIATVGDTLIPSSNPWHYSYGLQPSEDPINGRAPVGEEPIQFNPALARDLLNAAGWRYDELGRENTEAYPLCKYGGEDVLRFRFFSVSTQTFLDTAARQVMPWFEEAGIDLQTLYTIKSSNEANTAWKTADYDVWMWDWIFTPTSEPSIDIMSVMTSMEIGSWNGYFWLNETYDTLYNESLAATDQKARQEILDEMQRMLYDSHGVQHAAYKDDLYAVSTTNGEKWQNWGDWSAHWTLPPDALFPWLYMQLYPLDNPAPQVTPLEATHQDTTNHSFSIGLSAVDDDPMEYRFFFGDGTKSDWGPLTSVPHSYSKDGVYTVYMAAREVGTVDGFIGSNKMTVEIYDMSNLAPTNPDFTFTPSTPTSGDIVTLTGTATDPNGDPLSFTWDFGDGYTGGGQVVTHQFAAGVDSTVWMYVTDNHLGQGTRPVPWSKLVPVTPNTAPTSVVGNYPNVLVRKSTTFNVTSTDPDARDTRTVTWQWGDGTANTVTTLAYGQTKGSADHTYRNKGDFTLVVRVDDGTGLPGHNATGQNIVHVTDPNNHAPVFRSLTATPTTQYTGLVVNFSGRATDTDGDYLVYTFDFGDGTNAVLYDVPEGTTKYVEHTYDVASSPDVYSVYLTVYDGQAAPVTGGPVDVEIIQGNRAPVVSPLPEMWVTTWQSVEFTASATDADGDPLTYYWEFGDLTTGSGNPVTHVYTMPLTQVAYRVYVDDGKADGNVSTAAYIHVNMTDPPVANAGPDQIVSGGLVVQFDGSGSTDDYPPVNYTWTFTYDGGDVTLYEVNPTFVFWIIGDYIVTLTVTDGDGQTSTDTVTISIPDIIPEFPMLVLPVVGVAILLVGMSRRKKK